MANSTQKNPESFKNFLDFFILQKAVFTEIFPQSASMH